MPSAIEIAQLLLVICRVCCAEHFLREGSYEKVDVQVAASTKLPVADLEGDGHLVIFMQLLVEAFSRVSSELDVVGLGDGEEGEDREEEAEERCHRGQCVGARSCCDRCRIGVAIP